MTNEDQIAQHLLPVTNDKNILKMCNEQLEIFWLPDEIKVEKDIQDVLTNFSEAEKHAVITTLKLFSLYETHAGDEYWSTRFKKMFNGAEFHRLASIFSMFELAVHAPFYNKINELLHLDNEEFYLSYLDDPVLKERIKHVGAIISDDNDLLALGGFSMVEGAILYSSFGFLKHYQSQGKNKLLNVIRGINFSVRDESIHALAGAYCFKLLAKEYDAEVLEEVKQKLLLTADQILEHEMQINSMLFEKGPIEGITKHQLDQFAKSRLNECLINLGFEAKYDVSYNPVAEWFYQGINSYQFNDFFSGQGREYNRNWNSSDFKWNEEKENNKE